MPQLSIITVNLNNLEGLKKTMQSVFEQTFTDYEYIIIDGGSTDGSKEYINQHADKLTYWVSEKDGGIYKGMNIGILNSNGDYLMFLNSGDYLKDSSSLARLNSDGLNYDLIYGNIQVVDKDRIWEKKYPDKLTFKYFLKDTLPHPATLIKRNLFNKSGLYDDRLKIVADWNFFLNAVCKLNCSYHHLKEVVSVFLYDGISSIPANVKIIKKEKEKILRENFFAFLPDYEESEKTELQLKNILNSRWMRIRKQFKKFGL